MINIAKLFKGGDEMECKVCGKFVAAKNAAHSCQKKVIHPPKKRVIYIGKRGLWARKI